MTTLCDIFRDALTFTETLKGAPVALLRDELTLTERMAITPGVIIRDSLTIVDRSDGFPITRFRDSLVITDFLAASTSGVASTARDYLVFAETLRASTVDQARDSLTIADHVTGPINFARARDHLTIADVLTDVVAAGRMRDALHVTDHLSSQVRASLRDALTFTDRMGNISLGGNSARDTLTFTEVGDSLSLAANVLRDHLVIADHMTHRASTLTRFRDELFFTDGPEPLNVGGAWACSTDTYAMTRYGWLRWGSIGAVDGHVLVSGPAGIFLMEGADDDGVAIAAHMETGLKQIGVPAARDINARSTGDPSIKRTEGVAYIAYSSSGNLRLGIGITRDGVAEKTYWYPLPARIAAIPTTNRVKIGRGAASGFWRFLLENIDGADFMVKEQRFVLNPLSRRI